MSDESKQERPERSFKDSNGKEYRIRVTVGDVRTVKERVDVDLLKHAEGAALWYPLMRDPEKLVNIIYLLCKSQAEEAGIDDEQFGWNMAGDAIDDAVSALMEALTDFFPSAQRRLIRLGIEEMQRNQQIGFEEVEKTVKDERMQELVRNQAKSQLEKFMISLSNPQAS